MSSQEWADGKTWVMVTRGYKSTTESIRRGKKASAASPWIRPMRTQDCNNLEDTSLHDLNLGTFDP